MSSVRPEDIEQIAELAALQVDAETLPNLTEQIAQILEYVSQLDAVGAAHAPLRPDEVQDAGAAHASPLKPLRPDEVHPADLVTEPQSFAPAFMDGLFVVPRLSAMEDA